MTGTKKQTTKRHENVAIKAKAAKSVRELKKTAKTRRKASSKQRQTANLSTGKFRFLCDCMSGLAAAVLVGGLMSWRTTTSTKVLGLSTQLSAETILQTINLERAAKGLGPLSSDERLYQAAVAKGENMFGDNYWAHVNPSDGTEPWVFIQNVGYEYQSAGENLGRDFTSEKALVQAWMDSPSHRENILNPQFSDVGLAVLDGQIDGQPVVLIVNLFAQPKIGDGQITQIATYNQANDQLVLAGQVGPAEALLAGSTRRVLWWQWLVMAIVGGGMTLVLGKLHPRYPSRARRR
ncbi:hypothetical protein IJJ08_04665 [bacterium]|nr:hypothetical protein [bacterium]